jgi:hypothetical protein
VNIGKNI